MITHDAPNGDFIANDEEDFADFKRECIKLFAQDVPIPQIAKELGADEIDVAHALLR